MHVSQATIFPCLNCNVNPYLQNIKMQQIMKTPRPHIREYIQEFLVKLFIIQLEVYAFVGKTKAAKSTCALGFSYHNLDAVKTQSGDYQIQTTENDKYLRKLIGQLIESCTVVANMLTSKNPDQQGKKFCFIDFAGSQDSGNPVEILLSILYFNGTMLSKFKRVKFILTIEQGSIENAGARGFLDTLITFSQYFKDHDSLVQMLANSTVMLITKTNKTLPQLMKKIQNVMKQVKRQEFVLKNKAFCVKLVDLILEKNKVVLFPTPQDSQSIGSKMKQIFKQVQTKSGQFMSMEPKMIDFPMSELINKVRADANQTKQYNSFIEEIKQIRSGVFMDMLNLIQEIVLSIFKAQSLDQKIEIMKKMEKITQAVNLGEYKFKEHPKARANLKRNLLNCEQITTENPTMKQLKTFKPINSVIQNLDRESNEENNYGSYNNLKAILCIAERIIGKELSLCGISVSRSLQSDISYILSQVLELSSPRIHSLIADFAYAAHVMTETIIVMMEMVQKSGDQKFRSDFADILINQKFQSCFEEIQNRLIQTIEEAASVHNVELHRDAMLSDKLKLYYMLQVHPSPNQPHSFKFALRTIESLLINPLFAGCFSLKKKQIALLYELGLVYSNQDKPYSAIRRSIQGFRIIHHLKYKPIDLFDKVVILTAEMIQRIDQCEKKFEKDQVREKERQAQVKILTRNQSSAKLADRGNTSNLNVRNNNTSANSIALQDRDPSLVYELKWARKLYCCANMYLRELRLCQKIIQEQPNQNCLDCIQRFQFYMRDTRALQLLQKIYERPKTTEDGRKRIDQKMVKILETQSSRNQKFQKYIRERTNTRHVDQLIITRFFGKAALDESLNTSSQSQTELEKNPQNQRSVQKIEEVAVADN